MLDVNPRTRPSAIELLQHPWLTLKHARKMKGRRTPPLLPASAVAHPLTMLETTTMEQHVHPRVKTTMKNMHRPHPHYRHAHGLLPLVVVMMRIFMVDKHASVSLLPMPSVPLRTVTIACLLSSMLLPYMLVSKHVL
jgi:hypothetical protein